MLECQIREVHLKIKDKVDELMTQRGGTLKRMDMVNFLFRMEVEIYNALKTSSVYRKPLRKKGSSF